MWERIKTTASHSPPTLSITTFSSPSQTYLTDPPLHLTLTTRDAFFLTWCLLSVIFKPSFLLLLISFTLFTYPSASCWSFLLYLHWLPAISCCDIDHHHITHKATELLNTLYTIQTAIRLLKPKDATDALVEYQGKPLSFTGSLHIPDTKIIPQWLNLEEVERRDFLPKENNAKNHNRTHG